MESKDATPDRRAWAKALLKGLRNRGACLTEEEQRAMILILAIATLGLAAKAWHISSYSCDEQRESTTGGYTSER